MTRRRTLLYTAAAAGMLPVAGLRFSDVGQAASEPSALAITAPRTKAIDVSAATGKSINGPITTWTVGTGASTVEHVASTTSNGTLLAFYRSPNSNGWRVVDASAEAGRTLRSGTSLTSWLSHDGEFTVEHVAGVGSNGELLVFYWSPRNNRWRVVNATAEAGREVGSAGLTSWTLPSGSSTVEYVAGVDNSGSLVVFSWTPVIGTWKVVDASFQAGQNLAVGTPLTSWLVNNGGSVVRHIAGIATTGDLFVFNWSSSTARWQAVNASAQSGSRVSGGLTSWTSTSGGNTVEHVAAVANNGHLTVFWWSPTIGTWKAVDATRISCGPEAAGASRAIPFVSGAPEMVVARSAAGGLLLHWWTSALDWQVADLAVTTGSAIAGDPSAWRVSGSTAPERIAVRATNGHLLVFETGGQERQMVEALRTPVFGVRRSMNVRRKVLTILWDPRKPGISRPSKASVEAAVLGAINSARDYLLQVSDGLFTIESAGVLGWYESNYAPSEYWPPDGSPGRDSGAEAIRKAAAAFNFATFDSNNDGQVKAEELGVLFIMPGTGDGGGLNRVVGEDYTTRETAQGITVDGKKITWIAEVAIGSPPGHGIVAHELSHLLLGLGDMYFTFFTPSGSGIYSLMDQDGPGSHHDPANKLKLGWLHPRVILRSGRYRLPAVETGHVAWALVEPSRGTKEYFLIENRSPGTSYDKVLPDKGLAVWHVIEDAATFSTYPPPGVSKSDWDRFSGQWSRQGIRMIRPITTPPFNDRTALWDGADPATGYDLSLRWANGTQSGFRLRDIGPAGPVMEATIDVP